LNEEIIFPLLGLQVLRQHAEDARKFVAAAITPTGGATRDNKVGVTAGNPKWERLSSFFEK
jgi:hypothetical protein